MPMQRCCGSVSLSACIYCTFGWLAVLRIYVALAIFHSYRDLEAGDNQSLKSQWRDRELSPEPLAPQAKSLTTTTAAPSITPCEHDRDQTLKRLNTFSSNLV